MNVVLTRARGVAGLTRLPVTEEIAGSNPVGPASIDLIPLLWYYLFMSSRTQSPEKHPTWVAEHLEGLKWQAEQREIEAIEVRFPGLRRAFEEVLEVLPSRHSADNTEFPVAAGIATKGSNGKFRLVSRSGNRVNALTDPMAHAEAIVIKGAAARIGSKHLTDSVLITTLEPCVMCCGGAVNAALPTVVIGASHSDVNGKHALVNGEYKPWRVSPENFDTESYLTSSGIEVVSGYMRDEVLQAMQRYSSSAAEHYRDPDA